MSAKPQIKTDPPAPDAVSIEVNGRALQARKGQMIIQVTDAAGIYIPRFCYHHKLSVAANCRMCLVEVEKAPKPMPACATPVAEGMKVHTRSALARDAQKGVMEFLLINHPLDCPICDQGGECPLQDLALGYGKDVSRYALGKRVVEDKDIGPLIATELTRCIHCTRCVRFGQELAGVMELGMVGRGEHSEIRTFLARSVDSELSGNVIDLCPVGALTSKPFRFKARAWELASHPSVSPHDCVGSNLNVQSLRHEVRRVLPRENEAVNECWLSDRDRFSYEGLNSAERLRAPMIRQDGRWEEVDWTTALEHAAAGLKRIVERHGADALGALAAPASTLEEFYLLQKLVRGLGGANVDHRLRQLDFSDDALQPPFPGLGQPIEALERLEAVLLIGSNIRKEQPILGQRLRKAARRGARIMALNPVDYDFALPLAERLITDPGRLPAALAAVAKALAELKGAPPPEGPPWLAAITPDARCRAMAQALAQGERVAVVLGGLAAGHPHSAVLRALADWVAELAEASLALLAEGNSAGAWLAGCVPHRGPLGREVSAGRHAQAMFAEPRKAYLLLGLEPELDCLDAAAAARAMEQAELVVLLSAFKASPAMKYAHVLLPIVPFSETDGTFVNCEGRVQSFAAAVRPLGEARPAWKVLRVLGNRLGEAGFEHLSVADVRAELAFANPGHGARLAKRRLPPSLPGESAGLRRIAEVPPYRVDAVVRRAPALQRTADNPPPAAHLNPAQAQRLGLADRERVRVQIGETQALLDLVIDARVPDDAVLVPAAYPETAALAADGVVEVAKA